METDKERERHFKNAIANYRAWLNFNGVDIETVLVEADKELTFPEDAKDVIEYMGAIEALEMTETEKERTREFIREQIKIHGANEVWRCRLTTKLDWYLRERVF